MRKQIAIGALCLIGAFSAAMAAPMAPPGWQSVPLGAVGEAQAAIGRGGAGAAEGGGGSAPQTGEKTADLVQKIAIPLLFAFGGIVMGWAALVQRNAGMAVAVFLGMLVVGAFLIAPDSVKGMFKSIYRFVL